MIETVLLDYVVKSFLSISKDWMLRQRRRGPDFEIELSDGELIQIEVKSTAPNQGSIRKLVTQLSELKPPAKKFILVTPEVPTQAQDSEFKRAFKETGISAKWTTLRDLPAELGSPMEEDLSSPETIAKLQLDSLVGDWNTYQFAPMGTVPKVIFFKHTAEELAPLARQFSHRTLGIIKGDDSPLGEILELGKRTENITVVLSDIVNFSSLVSASRPEELKESMDRYYRLAREAVFDRGGMLDKFIGDAVLAVFGYPVTGAEDAVSAINLGQDLIEIGKGILPQWQENLNAVIETGTRIGIATGDLWPINIGSAEIEVTLLGDTINLAARLEKNCIPNNILIDNRTKTKAVTENSKFIEELELTSIQITPDQAKGQQFPIRAWSTEKDING